MGKKFKMLLIFFSLALSSAVYSDNGEIKNEEKIVAQESTTIQAVTEEKKDIDSEKEELNLKSNGKNENKFLFQLKKVYGFDEKQKSKLVPFVYYIGEAGLMAGAFYFNTDTFNLGGKTTSVLLYGPFTDIATSWTEMKDFKISKNVRIGGTLKLIKYNDIRNYWPGNNSPECEADDKKIYEFKTMYVKEKQGLIPKSELDDYRNENYEDLRGYQKYHGFNNKIAFKMAYKIGENTDLTFEPAYEVLKTQVSRYQSDTITAGITNKKMDDEVNPRNGYKVVVNVKKSLNLLGKDDENNWDFYKLVLDARKYFPVMKKSTIAFRIKTETTGGKKVRDENRSLIEGKEMYSYAPFFDMAMLGDFEIMRGSYMYRYWGKNSMLLQGEYRFPLFGKDNIQGTIFADIGRVGDEYKVKELFTDMNYNGGAGVRYYFNKDILMRVDMGVSEEGFQIRSNLGQAF